jgi:mono/diheme cytochrome c family protein
MKRALVLVLIGSVVGLAAFGAITVYDNEMGAGRMWETPAVRPHEEPILMPPANTVPVSGGELRYRVADPRTLVSPLTKAPPDEVIREGRTLYRTFCVQCHGRNLDGQGTVGQSFSPLPTDLRSAKVQKLADGVFFKEISYGIPNGKQPPLATTIELTDRWRIIAYVKSLGIRR